jgi:hypothetical protein
MNYCLITILLLLTYKNISCVLKKVGVDFTIWMGSVVTENGIQHVLRDTSINGISTCSLTLDGDPGETNIEVTMSGHKFEYTMNFPGRIEIPHRRYDFHEIVIKSPLENRYNWAPPVAGQAAYIPGHQKLPERIYKFNRMFFSCYSTILPRDRPKRFRNILDFNETFFIDAMSDGKAFAGITLSKTSTIKIRREAFYCSNTDTACLHAHTSFDTPELKTPYQSNLEKIRTWHTACTLEEYRQYTHIFMCNNTNIVQNCRSISGTTFQKV